MSGWLARLFVDHVGEAGDQLVAEGLADIAVEAVVGVADESCGVVEFARGERGARSGVDEQGDARIAPLALQLVEDHAVHVGLLSALRGKSGRGWHLP